MREGGWEGGKVGGVEERWGGVEGGNDPQQTRLMELE